MGMEKINGSNNVGLYKKKLKSGDVSLFFTLKVFGKLKWFKVGTEKNGYRVVDARKARTEKHNEINKIDKKDIQRLGRKKRTVLTFDEIFTHYIEYNLNHKVKKESYIKSNGLYNFRIKKHIGNIPIDKLTKEDIEKLALSNKNDNKNPICLTTVNMIIDLVRTVINYAIAHNLFIGNDLTKNIKRYPIDNHRRRFLSVEEIEELLEYTKENSKYNVYMCALLCLILGARINVIAHIKVKDFDLKNQTVKLFDEKGKNDKHYIGYINDKNIEIIKNHIENISKDKNSNEYILNDNSVSRRRYYQDYLRPILNELFNEGVEDRLDRVVVHSLRHTFGSQLVISGVDIYTVQKLMNHKDLEMTMRYAKLNDTVKRDGINKLNF